MDNKEQHRHDLMGKQWKVLEPILPEQGGQWGGIAKDNRLLMNAVLQLLRTGVSSRNLLSNRQCSSMVLGWRAADNWERILRTLAKNPNFEWLMLMRVLTKAILMQQE